MRRIAITLVWVRCLDYTVGTCLSESYNPGSTTYYFFLLRTSETV